MKYFVLLTFLLFALYPLGFYKKRKNISGWIKITQQQSKALRF